MRDYPKCNNLTDREVNYLESKENFEKNSNKFERSI